VKNLEIFLNEVSVDLSELISPTLTRVVSEYRNPLKKVGSFSYNITFPITQTNKKIFFHQQNLQKIGKFKGSKGVYKCIVRLNGIEVIVGEFILNKRDSKGFSGFISGSLEGRLGDIIDDEKVLRDIQSYAPIDFDGDRYVWDRLDAQLNADNSDIAFPFIFDSFARLEVIDNYLVDNVIIENGYQDFGISHFARNIFQKIFIDAGYMLQGSILESEVFKKLLLLYSNEDGDYPYNYAKLNPLTASMYYANAYDDKAAEGDDYVLYVYTPEVVVGDPQNSGDLSFSLSREGHYVCKYTSNYTFFLDFYSTYASNPQNNNAMIESKQFLLFREITEEPISNGDGMMPKFYNSLSFENVKDINTLNTYSGISSVKSNSALYRHTGSFTARLEEGKTYAAQIYLFIKKSILPNMVKLNANNGDTLFKITKVEGKQDLDVAKFLPNIRQIDFVQSMFKMFGLFYTIDMDEKTIMLYTRDEWYERNKNNIINISDKISLSEFEETPMNESEAAETYYRWATDDNDHILVNTDYIQEVNGDVSEDAYELPFAPLGFIAQSVIKQGSTSNFYLVDTIPAPVAIPASEIVDMRVLEDFSLSSKHNYKPKLCLYQGAGFLNNDMIYTDNDLTYRYLLSFGRTKGLTSSISTQYESFKHIPTVTFFDVKSQPMYRIDKLYATREFTLTKITGSAFDSTTTETITSVDAVKVLNDISLALNGNKSSFQLLYKNDILTTEWSNFIEGDMRMTATLYQKLTGRNIIRIDNDLYFLASISQYNLIEGVAKVKLYKMVTASE
jgi:hypothetical protein